MVYLYISKDKTLRQACKELNLTYTVARCKCLSGLTPNEALLETQKNKGNKANHVVYVYNGKLLKSQFSPKIYKSITNKARSGMPLEEAVKVTLTTYKAKPRKNKPCSTHRTM